MKKLFLILPLLLVSCNESNLKTPLQWCVYKIQQQQKISTDEYSYEEVFGSFENQLKEFKKADIKVYMISTFTHVNSYVYKSQFYCECIYKQTAKSAIGEKDIYTLSVKAMH